MRIQVKWLVLLAVIMAAFHMTILQPYFFLPRSDRAFLERHPSLDEVIGRFGSPDETITHNQRFKMTGWHPLPDSLAEYKAVSFVRPYGSKIYIFLDRDNRVSTLTISSS